MKGVLCHVINAGRLRCHTPRATSRMHHVARPSGAGTGRAVPDYRSQAKHRRRARQGRVTPRLELMTLGDNRLWFWSPTPTRVTGAFAPTVTTRGRQLKHTSDTAQGRWSALRTKGRQLILPTTCSPMTRGRESSRWQKWPSQSSTEAIIQRRVLQSTSSRKGETFRISRHLQWCVTLDVVVGGGGVGWVAFPPPHITTFSWSGVSSAAASFSLRRAGSEGGPNARRHNKDGKKQQDKEAEIIEK